MISKYEANSANYPLQPVMEEYNYGIPPINYHEKSYYNRLSFRSGRNSGRFSGRILNSGRSGFSEDLTEITEPSSGSEERYRKIDRTPRPLIPMQNVSIPSGPMLLLTCDEGHPFTEKINQLHFPDLVHNQNNHNMNVLPKNHQQPSEPKELNFEALKAFENDRINQFTEASVKCELLPVDYIVNYLKLTKKPTRKSYKFPTDNINNKINRFVSNNLIFLPKSSTEVTIGNNSVNDTLQSTEEMTPMTYNRPRTATDEPREMTLPHTKSSRLSSRHKNEVFTQVSQEITEKSAQNSEKSTKNSEKSDKYHIYNGYMITPDEIRPINTDTKESKAINTDPIHIKEVSDVLDVIVTRDNEESSTNTIEKSGKISHLWSGLSTTSDQHKRSKSPTIFYPKRIPILPPDLLDDIRFDEEKTKKRFLSMKSITEKDWINLKSLDLSEDDLNIPANINQNHNDRFTEILRRSQNQDDDFIREMQFQNDSDWPMKEVLLKMPEKMIRPYGDIWNTLGQMDEKIRSMEQLGDSIDKRFNNSRKITLESQKSQSMFNINQKKNSLGLPDQRSPMTLIKYNETTPFIETSQHEEIKEKETEKEKENADEEIKDLDEKPESTNESTIPISINSIFSANDEKSPKINRNESFDNSEIYRRNKNNSPDHSHIRQHDLLHSHNHSKSTGYIPAIFRENSRQREMREMRNAKLRRDSARQMAEDVLNEDGARNNQPEISSYFTSRQVKSYEKTMNYVMNEQKRKLVREAKNDTARSTQTELDKPIFRKVNCTPYYNKVRLQRPEATRQYKCRQKPKSYSEQLQELQLMDHNKATVVLRESRSSICLEPTNRISESSRSARSHAMPDHIKKIVYNDDLLFENNHDETISANSSYINWDEINELIKSPCSN